MQNVAGLGVLEPFGEGNEKPLFVLEKMQVAGLIPLSGGAHTKLQLRRDRAALDAVLFRMSPEETGIRPGAVLDFLVSAEVRQYNGNSLLSLRVEDWRLSEKAQEQAVAAQAAYESYRRGEPLPAAYYQRMCPHRKDLVAVYQTVGAQPVPVARVCEKLAASGMNRCRARVCADIFSELGLMRYDAAADTLARLPVTEKRDLSESKCYQDILSLAGRVPAAK